jgi:hypothetical protein
MDFLKDYILNLLLENSLLILRIMKIVKTLLFLNVQLLLLEQKTFKD